MTTTTTPSAATDNSNPLNVIMAMNQIYGTTTEMQDQILTHARILLRDTVQLPRDGSHKLSIIILRKPQPEGDDVATAAPTYTAVVMVHGVTDPTSGKSHDAIFVEGKASKDMKKALHVLLEAACEMMEEYCQRHGFSLQNTKGVSTLSGSGVVYWDGTPEDKDETQKAKAALEAKVKLADNSAMWMFLLFAVFIGVPKLLEKALPEVYKPQTN